MLLSNLILDLSVLSRNIVNMPLALCGGLLIVDVVRTAIANNVCKFHEDRLNDGVTIYFIVAKPRGSGETFFSNRCALHAL